MNKKILPDIFQNMIIIRDVFAFLNNLLQVIYEHHIIISLTRIPNPLSLFLHQPGIFNKSPVSIY